MDAWAEILRRLEPLRPAAGPFLVGVTGSVAVGKTTFAQALAERLGGAAARIEVVATDGFLLPNTLLEERGLAMRKGFPETYDSDAMAGAFAAIRAGEASFPVYSHVLYDVDAAAGRKIAPPAWLIVEGLGLAAGASAAGLDALIFLDAPEAAIEAWFVARFLGLIEAARREPGGFYDRFAALPPDQARETALWVWREINLPNLRAHIGPARAVADVVVEKGPDHVIVGVAGPRT